MHYESTHTEMAGNKILVIYIEHLYNDEFLLRIWIHTQIRPRTSNTVGNLKDLSPLQQNHHPIIIAILFMEEILHH